MLPARYIATLGDDVTALYSELELEIKKSIFRHLNKIKYVDDYAVYQMNVLQQTGALHKDVIKIISVYDKKAQKLLLDLYNEAMKKACLNDLRFSPNARRLLSKEQQQLLNTAIDRLLEPEAVNKTYAARSAKFQHIYSTFTRMTATVADATNDKFLKEINNAYMRVSSGAFSWTDSFRSCVNTLATEGVKTVYYTGSGQPREFSLESASRMNIITGINQQASQQTLENCSELETDLVEVSAHIGARDGITNGPLWANHAQFQGKVYCLQGERDYKDADGITRHAYNFQEYCGLGEANGICGINCRHSFYPYFEGLPLMYSNGELDEMNDKTVILDNKEITPYEAEQKLRYYEREIRNAKSKALGYEMTKQTDNNPKYIDAKNRIWEAQEQARHICKETGIERKYINEYIGTPDGKQPTGLKPE